MTNRKEQFITLDQRLNERIKLWESVVKDSVIPEEVKGKFLDVVRGRIAKGKLNQESIEDWIYYSINMLLNVAEHAKKEGVSERDGMSIFENLRDDIWQF